VRNDSPKYEQIVQIITHMIESGEFDPDGRVFSIAEIRDRFQVSVTTAQRVQHELELSGHVVRKKGLGTFVNAGAHTPPGPARTWGYVMPAINPQPALYVKIIGGLEETAHDHNINLIVANSHDIPERQDAILRRMIDSGVSGIAITPHMKPAPSFTLYLQLLHHGIPFVFCNRCVSGINAPLVTANHQQGGYLATRHLIELGRRRIGFLSTSRSHTATERFGGYLRALSEAGLEPDEDDCVWMESFEQMLENMRETTRRKLREGWRPDAVFACSDLAAYGFYQAIRDEGLRCPEDIALVGHDDIDPPRGFDVHLTSVAYPAYDSGRTCAELLLRMQAGENLGLNHVLHLEPQLVVRGSTDSDYRETSLEEQSQSAFDS